MKRFGKFTVLLLLSGLFNGAGAAPLFPDIKSDRWATDAVRTLAAKGLKVTSLEDDVGFVERRVTELERISFYGTMEARATFQAFGNDGVGDNDGLRNGGGLMGNVPYLNYNQAVGSAVGASRRPQLHAIMPVVDFRNGRALTNGTGFTSRATLGLKILVSPTMDAGAEFSAFSSQGDSVIDAYWGVSAPWLSNPFTANRGGDLGAQPLHHTPYTRMNLDKFWLHHKPSHTKVIFGEIIETQMDPLVYMGQVNLGVYGPGRWAGFGVDVNGEFSVSEDDKVSWELFRTQFGSGNSYLGTNYQNYVIGGNAAYHFHDGAGKVQLNLLRIAEEAPTGGPLRVGGFGPGGGTNGMNVALDASSGWTVRQWVNPPGYFAGRQSAFHQAQTGQLIDGVFQPNLTDVRPISGWNGSADNSVGFSAGGGNFGPQSQTIYGLSGVYRWALGEGDGAPTLGLKGRWARSDYRPSRNSAYSAPGDAVEVVVDAQLLDQALDLGLVYLAVDAHYAPAAWFGNVLGVRFPRSMNFTGVWHLHNFAQYPHNREGFRMRGEWKFNQGAGRLWAEGKLLNQKTTSLYDVRVTPGILGIGVPTGSVIGFSPGFVDPIFSGFAHPSIYGASSGNAFTANLAPLENPRGSENGFELGVQHRWEGPALTVKALYGHTSLSRKSSLSPLFGGDQNHVDLDIDVAHLSLGWQADKKLTLTGGADYTRSAGHLDPGGLYHAYALNINSNRFTNIDSEQLAPFISLDYKLSEKTNFGITARHFSTLDRVDPAVRAGTAFDSFGATAHPFDWSGLQLESYFSLKF